MLFRKKTKIEWPLIIFGLIALGIIIATAVLVMLLLSKADRFVAFATKTQPAVVSNVDSPVELVESYNRAVTELLVFIKSGNSLEVVTEKTEDFLFSTRVPRQMLDKHLQAAVQSRQFDKDKMTKEDLVNLIKTLLAEE